VPNADPKRPWWTWNRVKAALPPRFRTPAGLAIGAGGLGAVLLLLAVIIYVVTDSGTIKIQLSDPKAEVQVKLDGQTIEIAGLKEPLTLKAGEHGLVVTSGEFETVTQSFTVRRGDNPVLYVALERKQTAPAEVPAPVTLLRLKPVGEQTVEAGNPLTVPVSVENADAWKAKLQFSLAGQAPPGARIDPHSGEFSWTPPADQAAGQYLVTISVVAEGGFKDETSFSVNVRRLTPPLRLHPIALQSVEAGKLLSVTVIAESPGEGAGNLQYGLGPGAPPGAVIDPATGEFSWTPSAEQAEKQYNVTASARAPDGRESHLSFTITVTRPAPPKKEKEISFDLGNGVKLEMVLIPAGEFLMGSPDSENGRFPDEGPQHRVRITRPFYLGKYLVTQEQWQAVMGNNPSNFKGPENPVEMVSWDDCQQFLAKLNAKTSEQPGKFVLPTEAQWEYACRAGSKTRYCFGDDDSELGEYAWYHANSGGKTHPVGGKKSNAWGLYDMHGNVWEWCQDWYDEGYYAKSPTDDPAGSDGGANRVFRGGGWSDPAGDCRSAPRYRDGPGIRYGSLGFRASLVPADK
jgi:formylglycine-generating enzyme required for sulfatase activity